MTNHQNRAGPFLAIYTRADSGALERHTVRGFSKASHQAHYAIGSVTATERLTGWPEQYVEWHDRTGYGVRQAEERRE